jgi:hypothetical protein
VQRLDGWLSERKPWPCPYKIQVHVTNQDIADAEKLGRDESDPIALALQRLLPEAEIDFVIGEQNIGRAAVSINFPGGVRAEYDIETWPLGTSSAANWLTTFEDGGDVGPKHFRLKCSRATLPGGRTVDAH